MAKVSSRDIQEIVEKLSLDKVKAREVTFIPFHKLTIFLPLVHRCKIFTIHFNVMHAVFKLVSKFVILY